MEKLRKDLTVHIILFLMVQSLILFGLIRSTKYYYMHDVAASTVFFTVYALLDLKYSLNLGSCKRVLIIITILSHHFFGQYLGLYLTSHFFDKALHVFGTYSFSISGYFLLNCLAPGGSTSRARESVLAAALGLSLGAAFEIIEFLSDIIVKPVAPYQMSLLDTDLDIIADMAGAVISALHVYFTVPRAQIPS